MSPLFRPGCILFWLKLFGSASIDGPDAPVTGRAVQRRRLGLLALLAIAGRRGVTRDKLIGYLWPDSDPERARHLLSDSIYRINQAVGGDAVIAVGDELRLNPERLPCDAWEFADAIDRRDWERAVELHVAPFMDGFFLTDADELERWVDAQRERLARERARALEALADAAEARGALTDAVRWWRLLAGQDPYSSRVALRLMRVLDRTGDRPAALQHAHTHSVLLEEEMELAPDAELLHFVAELRSRPVPPPKPLQKQPAHEAPGSAASTDASAADAAQTLPAAPAARRLKSLAAVVGAAMTVIAAAWLVVTEQRGDTGAGAPAIAVLPFADLSTDGTHAYFADGITEELIVRLSQIEGLRVVGRSSAFAFRDQTIDVREAASRLNATAVLQGSVRHHGDTVRIVAQLIDGSNGYELWTETYEHELRDVFAIQDDISRQIEQRLRGVVAGADAVALSERVGTPPDPAAFNLYLRGRHEWHRRTKASLLAAADYFRQAVEQAPGYARAHVGLGDAYAVLGFYDFLPPREAFPAAADAARRALKLEPSLGEPHATLGYVALYYDWDWPRAEREFRRAIELEPGYSTAHQWYANFLTAMGRFDEAISEMEAAMELDPLSVVANAALGWVLYFAGDYDRAIDQCTRALELNPEFALAYLWRAMAHEERGSMDAALRDFDRAVRLSGGSTLHVALHARAIALAGRRDEARALVQQLESRKGSEYLPPYEMAKVQSALGDTDAALQWLEHAHDHRSHSIAFLAVDPQLQRLRGEPRFQQLVRRARLDRTPDARSP